MDLKSFNTQPIEIRKAELSTNGLLKRALALTIFSRNGYYVIGIYLISLSCFIINGLGWISISTETLCLILTGGLSLSQSFLREREAIVSFYFISGESELEKMSKTQLKQKQINENEDIQSNLN